MTLVGIDIEGVGPFASRRRIELGPGSIVVIGANESGKSTLLDLLALLLDPDPELEVAPFLRTNPPPERSWAGLDLRDADGPFRVEVDFDAREVSLQEGDGPVFEAPTEAVCDALGRRLGLPGRGPYERLFSVSAERLAAAARGGRLSDAQRALEAKVAARGLRAARATVDALRARLASVREHEVQQDLREAERQRIEDLEVGRVAAREARLNLDAVEAELARWSALAGAPADLEERVVDYERLAAELSRAEADLARTAEEVAQREAELRAPSVARRALLLAGAALAAGGVALWLLSSLLGPPLLGLGVAVLAGGGLAAARVRLARADVERDRSEADDRTRMLRHRFELETVAVRSLATALDLPSPGELPVAIAHHRELVARRDAAREAVEALGSVEEVEAEIRTVRARLEAIPEPTEPDEPEGSAQLRVKLEAAERELRLAERAAHEAAARAAAEEIAPGAWTVEELLRAAGAFAGSDGETAWRDAEGLAGAYVRALSGRRYVAVRRKGDGRYLLEREGREPLPLEDATGTAAECFQTAVQFALVERTALHHPLPLLLDDPFVGLDGPRLRGAARCVRRLGAITQVVLATFNPAFESVADRTVRL